MAIAREREGIAREGGRERESAREKGTERWKLVCYERCHAPPRISGEGIREGAWLIRSSFPPRTTVGPYV